MPADILAADMSGGYPLRKTAPAWGSLTVPPCAVTMMTPAVVAADAASIKVPILIAMGERDVCPDPHAEPSAYKGSNDVSLFIVARMAHMHNFASTRAVLWSRIESWSRRIASRPLVKAPLTDVPLGTLLERCARERPATQLHFHLERGRVSTTTGELAAAGRRLARALAALGLRRGDAIAIQMPTAPETAVLYLAALEIGAMLVPIVHIYGPAEVGFILRQSRARFLVVPDRWRGIDFLERVEAIGALPDLERVVVVGERAPAGGITLREVESLAAQQPEPRAWDCAPAR